MTNTKAKHTGANRTERKIGKTSSTSTTPSDLLYKTKQANVNIFPCLVWDSNFASKGWHSQTWIHIHATTLWKLAPHHTTKLICSKQKGAAAIPRAQNRYVLRSLYFWHYLHRYYKYISDTPRRKSKRNNTHSKPIFIVHNKKNRRPTATTKKQHKKKKKKL